MKYVALLRGIGPSNPNMHGSKLAGVLESLGFRNAQPLLSGGNVVFESNIVDIPKLEATIHAAWPKQLGFPAHRGWNLPRPHGHRRRRHLLAGTAPRCLEAPKAGTFYLLACPIYGRSWQRWNMIDPAWPKRWE